jgi:hypothetical protein
MKMKHNERNKQIKDILKQYGIKCWIRTKHIKRYSHRESYENGHFVTLHCYQKYTLKDIQTDKEVTPEIENHLRQVMQLKTKRIDRNVTTTGISFKISLKDNKKSLAI